MKPELKRCHVFLLIMSLLQYKVGYEECIDENDVNTELGHFACYGAIFSPPSFVKLQY